MATPRKWLSTGEEFRQAVAESLSVWQVLGRSGLAPAGGNYEPVQHHIKWLKLGISHFMGAG